MNLGYKCDAQDGKGKWYEGTVVQLALGSGDMRVKIYFLAGKDGAGLEEWIPRMSDRLQKLGTEAYAGVHDGMEAFTKIGGALRVVLAQLMPDASSDEREELTIRCADCGVFTAAQLQASIMQWSPAHWLETPIYKGKMRLMRFINELLVTRSGSDFNAPLSGELLQSIMDLLNPPASAAAAAGASEPEPEQEAAPLPAWDQAAAGVEASTIDGLMEVPLAGALVMLERLELRKRMVRIGIRTGAKFLELADLKGVCLSNSPAPKRFAQSSLTETGSPAQVKKGCLISRSISRCVRQTSATLLVTR